jgi:alginate O-acetyltransferase complex protein AlgJ
MLREFGVNKNSSLLKGYSIFFITIVFSILLSQIFVSGITLKSISDNYLWKKSLIKSYFNFKFMIGDRVYARAVIGKSGWLFYTGDMSIQDYQKTAPINVGNMKLIINALGQIKKKTDQSGGTFLLVIPPDKSTVYSKYMPDEIPVIGQASNFDRLVERIKSDSNIQVLDLRPVFMNMSETSQIYYKTDSHWNCLGAFYAYNEIVSKLADLHPNLQAYTLSDFQIIPSQNSLLDLPSSMGLNLKEEAMDAVPKFDVKLSILPALDGVNIGKSLRIVTNSKKDLPDLIIFHDSFYNACLDKFIEPTVSRTISLHYGDAGLGEQLNLIEKEKPDIVIFEFVERQMDFLARYISK